jgi:hypothetical protein
LEHNSGGGPPAPLPEAHLSRSLLTMSHATQRPYDHGVPKTGEAVGERISLAFRVKPSAGAGADPDR